MCGPQLYPRSLQWLGSVDLLQHLQLQMCQLAEKYMTLTRGYICAQTTPQVLQRGWYRVSLFSQIKKYSFFSLLIALEKIVFFQTQTSDYVLITTLQKASLKFMIVDYMINSSISHIYFHYAHPNAPNVHIYLHSVILMLGIPTLTNFFI
ncbi:hypothetical protein Hdeb2414_s0026g00682531 [Helianthus debilis subsp. tardiflorus]